MKSVIYVSKASDIPDEDHYAIIVSSARDDGWGGTTGCVEYTAFLDRTEWENEIKKKMLKGYLQGDWKAIHVKPATVSMQMDIK